MIKEFYLQDAWRMVEKIKREECQNIKRFFTEELGNEIRAALKAGVKLPTVKIKVSNDEVKQAVWLGNRRPTMNEKVEMCSIDENLNIAYVA